MIINIALWNDRALFGNFGSDLRDLTNPSHQHCSLGRQADPWLPDMPFFEALGRC